MSARFLIWRFCLQILFLFFLGKSEAFEQRSLLIFEYTFLILAVGID